MNNNVITFSISKNEKIIIPFDVQLTELYCCHFQPIFFVTDKEKIMLGNSTIDVDIKKLKKNLEHCLKGSWRLDGSITEDIGYLYNEFYQDSSRFVVETINDFEIWVGYKYQIWQVYDNGQRFITWLYNDEQGAIDFEITPSYPFLYCDPEEEENYMPYGEWIKTYEPYFKTIISYEIAQQWLEQANVILQQIKDNITRWEVGEQLK